MRRKPSVLSAKSVVKNSRFKNQGYEGARFTQSRGYVYFPTLDSTRDLDSFSLYELRRRSRWLYVNSGFATRCIDGIANMIGSLTPIPLTDDKEWNQLALRRFNDMAGNAGVFDAGARFDFWRSQPMVSRLRLTDGDASAILTSTEQNVGRVAFYEAHQIDNPKEAGSSQTTKTRWCDGVLTSPQGRPIQYNIVTGDQYSTSRTDTQVDATDFIFHCEYRRPGRVRGEPALRHAINHMLDSSEIVAFTKTSIKNAAQIGYQITRAANEFVAGPTFNPRGMGSGARNSTVTTKDGSTANIKIEDALKAGKIAEMNPGEEVKMILDQRPHPNQVEFLEYLARDIAWGVGCSSDILWNIAKLGGATVRYVMADAQQTLIEPGQELLADQYCSRFWIYFIAKELKSKRLQPCKDQEWWKHGWQPQQKLTVDIGRDGKLYIDMHKSGMISLKRYHAQLGQNWKQETDDYLDERAYIVKATKDRGLTMQDAFPPENPQQVTTTDNTDGTDTENENSPSVSSVKSAVKNSPGKLQPLNIHVAPPSVTVNMAEQKPSTVNLHPVINNPSQPPPQITLNVPKNDIVIPAAQITVQQPKAETIVIPAPQVTVNNKIDIPTSQSLRVKRDKDGNMTGAEVTKG